MQTASEVNATESYDSLAAQMRDEMQAIWTRRDKDGFELIGRGPVSCPVDPAT